MVAINTEFLVVSLVNTAPESPTKVVTLSFMYRFTSRAVGAFANDPKLAVAPEYRQVTTTTTVTLDSD